MSWTLDITKLGAKRTDHFLDGVRIIFISTSPTLGPVVIGWYKNARVWRHAQPGVRNVPGHPENVIDYLVECQADNAFLLPMSERTMSVPTRKKGFPGQSAVFFPDQKPEMIGWMKEFETFFQSRTEAPAAPAKKPAGYGHGNDLERNALIEIAAIEAVIALLGPTYRDRQSDNCGWDLEFDADGKVLCVEVKGNSGLSPRAEVSPNEYRTIGEVVNGRFSGGEYRLAIVTDALGGRKVHLFRHAQGNGWTCDLTGLTLQHTERVAATFG